MKPALIVSIFLLFLSKPELRASGPSSADSAPTVRQIMERVLASLKTNDEKTKDFGFFQDTVSKELEEDGTISEQKKRTYKIVWIENEPYAEMIRFNDQPLTAKLKTEEQKRRAKFVKALRTKEKDEDEDDLTWEELFQKYEFREEQPASEASYVISFKPKSGKLAERSRAEKIYNNLSGTIWIGSDYSLLKVVASLSKNLRFGLGILGNVQDLEMSYSQQRFQDLWMPDQLYVKYKARVFISTRNQELTIRFYDPYKRTAPPALN
jgi:hypothetical protein